MSGNKVIAILRGPRHPMTVLAMARKVVITILGLAVAAGGFAIWQAGSQDRGAAFEIVLKHKNSTNEVNPAHNVHPGPAEQIFLGYTDCRYIYECFCQHAFSYHLRKVPRSRGSLITNQLRDLNQGPMFGCTKQERSLFDLSDEFRCRTVRRIQLKATDPAFEELSVPSEAGSDLTVWIESAVRVDPKGLPLEEAEPEAMPIFIEGNGKEYEVIEEYKPRDIHCMMRVTFSGKVIECKKSFTCLHKAQNAYSASLLRQFSREPLGASEVHDEPVPPGEIWLRREFQPSHVLGAPYFEL